MENDIHTGIGSAPLCIFFFNKGVCIFFFFLVFQLLIFFYFMYFFFSLAVWCICKLLYICKFLWIHWQSDACLFWLSLVKILLKMLNLWGWWEFSQGPCPSPLYIYGTSPKSPTPPTHRKVRASLIGNFKHQFSVLNNITHIFTLFFITHISKNTIFKLFYQTALKVLNLHYLHVILLVCEFLSPSSHAKQDFSSHIEQDFIFAVFVLYSVFLMPILNL